MVKKSNKFNNYLHKIILEEELDIEVPPVYTANTTNINANNSLLNIEDESTIKYIDQTIAIVPGSFKPPHKGHWEMILKYCEIADKVIIVISNISYIQKLNSQLSKTNLKPLAGILAKITDYNKDAEYIKNIIISDVDQITFTELEDIIINKLIPVLTDNKITSKLDNYLVSLREKLFSNLRKTSIDTIIEPEISQQIFEIYRNVYNLNNKVEIIISNSASPFGTMLYIIENECKDCTIYLGVSEKGEDNTRFDFVQNTIEKNARNLTNEIIPYPVKVQTMLSATDIRNNISNLQKDWFPDKLSESNFEQIKHLLLEQ